MPRDERITSKIMSSVPSKGTKAEIEFGRALWGLGLRYRKHRKDLPGTPDFALISSKIAVFVDGDFWHGNCQNRGYSTLEEQFEGINNSEWWIDKIKRNIERDRRVDLELKRMGFRVMRFWESEIAEDAIRCARRVEKAHIQRLARKANGEARVRAKTGSDKRRASKRQGKAQRP